MIDTKERKMEQGDVSYGTNSNTTLKIQPFRALRHLCPFFKHFSGIHCRYITYLCNVSVSVKTLLKRLKLLKTAFL